MSYGNVDIALVYRSFTSCCTAFMLIYTVQFHLASCGDAVLTQVTYCERNLKQFWNLWPNCISCNFE